MRPTFVRSERGAINFMVLLFIAILAAAAYFGYAYIPHWMANRKAVSAMHAAGYQAWRLDDATLLEMVLQETDKLILVDDGDGPYPAVDETMVKISRDSKNIYIDMGYEVPMWLPWVKKPLEIRFENHTKTDLENPSR